MGKGGRIACIFTPWVLTVASLICIIIIEIAGWNKSLLSDYYFIKANFSDLSVSGAGDLANTTTLTAALQQAQQSNTLEDVYEVHLWNYCTTDEDGSNVECSDRHANFYFDLVSIWGLNSTAAAASSTSTSSRPSAQNNPIQNAADNLQDKTEGLERELLGDAGEKAYTAYKKVAKAMFILYAVAFWTELATLALSLFAICSRWGSLFTWLFSFVSSVITLAAVATTTGVYLALLGALRGLLDPYDVKLQLGSKAFTVAWLGVAFSWAATLFWLFSICCCSGASNPHHKSNKGGLWNAEPKGQGYGDYRGRGLKVEKTGGYERVNSPFLGHAEQGHGDRVPLQQYPQQQTGYTQGAYEPFRHN
ncbi:uncharacterized protein LTR77_003371 [Saxophila tyrrhenica]|uniref:Integral membrane protein n=1 Tax=Saxophila tyrrhenica TaxID=1690608 RepID=A0AAV9PDH8_9PEZI|nr:hypothetical protein LTR77_003371 [Saxophila tyrrhenica]